MEFFWYLNESCKVFFQLTNSVSTMMSAMKNKNSVKKKPSKADEGSMSFIPRTDSQDEEDENKMKSIMELMEASKKSPNKRSKPPTNEPTAPKKPKTPKEVVEPFQWQDAQTGLLVLLCNGCPPLGQSLPGMFLFNFYYCFYSHSNELLGLQIALKEKGKLSLTQTQIKSKLNTTGVACQITSNGNPKKESLTSIPPSIRMTNFFIIIFYS